MTRYYLKTICVLTKHGRYNNFAYAKEEGKISATDVNGYVTAVWGLVSWHISGDGLSTSAREAVEAAAPPA